MIPIYFDIWDKIYSLNPTLKLFVITNGTKLNKRVKEVLSRQNFEIAVSIDGATPDTFQKIRKKVNYAGSVSCALWVITDFLNLTLFILLLLLLYGGGVVNFTEGIK